MTTRATCHCGAVELRIDLAQPLSEAARCDCSFCMRRGVPTVSVLVGALEVVRGAEALTLYTFHTGTAKHYFCSVCGIYTHHRRRSDPGQFGVNVACIDGVNLRDMPAFPWTDGIDHPSDR